MKRSKYKYWLKGISVKRGKKITGEGTLDTGCKKINV